MSDLLYRALVTVIRVFLAVAFATLTAVVFFQVIARYLFDAPPFWTEELARFLLIWLTFIGAVLAHVHREHIAVDTFVLLLPRRLRQAADLFASLTVLLTLAVIAKGGFDIAMMGTQTAPALGISMRYIYMSLPIGACLMMLVTVANMLRPIATPAPGKDAQHGA
jgi:TRAP-type C4-dicarboxylate transport system permease small subunit